MNERRQKQFAVCLMLCGLSGLINGLNSIFSLGIPKWALVILSLPAALPSFGWWCWATAV